MKSLKIGFLIPLLGAVILFTSCETADKKKRAAVVPPTQATAPALTQPAAFTAKHAPRQIEENRVPAVDPVETLIKRVEKEYQAGQANYSAGHLEAAKENFDRAFNILLQGPPAVSSDDRLQAELDKLVDAVNSLELLALKEGDGFTEQRLEPAPIDEANEVTFPVDPNIRAKAAEEVRTTISDLPLLINDPVASYINYFSSRARRTLENGFIRSGRYSEMIRRIFKEEGVPQDLIYLAQAESGFHPLALSRAGARGMWQFMASRGVGYGLQRNWWVDDRQDPEKATRAAARHLKDLYKQFGDWHLAMAAYNSGPGTVQRAVQRTGYADYWELYKRGVLPAETRNYVPIILAITIMSKNPAQYGLDRLSPDRPISTDKVEIDYPVDLRLVAECVDTSVSTLQELNPSLLRLTTPKEGKFSLRVPLGTSERFETAIAKIPAEMRVWWRYHRVSANDTLAGVARKYRTTAEAIAKANDLDPDSELRSQAKLIIPIAPGRSNEGQQRYSRAATKYKVRKGDTVLSVADDFGVSAESLRKWNRLRGNALKVGRTLTIHRPLASADSDEPETRSAASNARSTRTARAKSASTRNRQGGKPVSKAAAKSITRSPSGRKSSKTPVATESQGAKRTGHDSGKVNYKSSRRKDKAAG